MTALPEDLLAATLAADHPKIAALAASVRGRQSSGRPSERERAVLVDLVHEGRTTYVLPPPMAGFFEFALMRVRADIDQRLLSELYYQYLNVEEDFVRELFARGETHLGRTFVHEPALPEADDALDEQVRRRGVLITAHVAIDPAPGIPVYDVPFNNERQRGLASRDATRTMAKIGCF